MMRIWGMMTGAILLAGVLAVGGAQAQQLTGDAAANAQKYQVNVMKAMGGQMALINSVMRNEVPFKGHVKEHAESVHGLAMTFGDLFGPGTEKVAGTKAKPEIIADKDKVAGIIKMLQDESAKLVQVAATNDAAQIGPQLQKIGAQCAACHSAYRMQ